MRYLPALGLAALMLIVAGADANAARFCARYTGGGENCGFYTFEQCLAAISGVGGFCTENPRWVAERRGRRYWR
jgi:Protein of unknown function (DUF3551)